jgi:rhamnosyltransferase
MNCYQVKVSIIIRTLNEDRHLSDLLEGIRSQITSFIEVEVILVDSGSTDDTICIAESYQCRIEHIRREEFSFGRSLNIGCEAASGDVLVIVSGHCIPTNEKWLANLLYPLIAGNVAMVYGRQIGDESSRFSECMIFDKYFPAISQVPQEGFYCNNANSALLRSVWQKHRFDENLTGLEDLYLAKQLVGIGMKIGYVADAVVFHLHQESWSRIRHRFEREAFALQHIMPEVHLDLIDILRYFMSSIALDSTRAFRRRCFLKYLPSILMYRLMQYWGSYRGNHLHRKISNQRKDRYFYPR